MVTPFPAASLIKSEDASSIRLRDPMLLASPHSLSDELHGLFADNTTQRYKSESGFHKAEISATIITSMFLCLVLSNSFLSLSCVVDS